MTYGITAEGFVRKPESAIVASFEQRQLATIAPDLDVSAESIFGQANGIVAREIGICWELLEILARANDPEQATGDLLEQICKLSGTERRGASYSTVVLSCALDAATLLESGVAYAAVDGDPTSLWTPEVDFTAAGAGSYDVVYRAESPGSIAANAGTITVIHSPVVGWNSVTNALDANVGRGIDTDETLRLRREEQIANAGSSTARAIRANLDDIDGIDSARVFENYTNVVNADGLPPHSIEVLLYEQDDPVANDVIAQTVFDSKAAGIRTHGTESGTAVDANSVEHVVRFSRPEALPVYVVIEVATVDGYVGDSAVADRIVAQGRATYLLGDPVKYRQLDSVVFGLGGVDDVTVFALGFSPAPTGTTNLVVGPRQIATFDTSRVTVTSTP